MINKGTCKIELPTFCAILLCRLKPNIRKIGWKLREPIRFEKRLMTDGQTDGWVDVWLGIGWHRQQQSLKKTKKNPKKTRIHSLGPCTEKKLPIDAEPTHFITQFHQFCGINARARVFSSCCTSAKHAGIFDCLMSSLILITMDNGRACAQW